MRQVVSNFEHWIEYKLHRTPATSQAFPIVCYIRDYNSQNQNAACNNKLSASLSQVIFFQRSCLEIIANFVHMPPAAVTWARRIGGHVALLEVGLSIGVHAHGVA